MALPLEGTKVLDLSRLAPGPFCTMILGDFGADVIKVEGPREGRLAAGSVSLSEDTQKAAAYAALERNKRSITLNLKSEKGRNIFYQLAQGADVLLEGFRPGVVKRLGIDYETIKGINPRIVYCSLTGYGQDGPYHNLPGHDINYISVGGALGIMGIPGGPPTIPRNLIADYAAGGMQAAIGILVALMAREKTGRGQHVDIAMTDGVVSLMAQPLAEFFASGMVPERGNERTTGGWPNYNVYETKDGKYISIGCLEPWFFENICRALGMEGLIPYQNTAEKWGEIFAAFREIFRTKTRDEWFDLLKEQDVCVAKVYELDELERDPQLVHRNMIVEVDTPALGKVKQAGISIKLSETPGRIRSVAPLRGQHTEEILLTLGYSKEQIEGIQGEGATA